MDLLAQHGIQFSEIPVTLPTPSAPQVTPTTDLLASIMSYKWVILGIILIIIVVIVSRSKKDS
jgi:hypothetical protein